MKDKYDFSASERGKFLRKRVRSAVPQTGIGDVFVDREGYTIVVFPEHIHVEHKTMRARRCGEKVILSPIKKRRARVQPRRRLTADFRETVRARAERDPAFLKALRQEIKRAAWRKAACRQQLPGGCVRMPA